MTANIFDIQRYSIHDGDGIRTTVFFKGCGLRCRWCSNPESQQWERQLFFVQKRCIGCGACTAFHGITMGETGPVIDRSAQIDIDGVANACPTEAMTVKGRQMTVEQVLEIVEKDMPYYIRSGGGVTLSGGEALLQADFAAELLRRCKEKGISTTVETEGFVPFENLQKVLPFVDKIYFDIKAADTVLHKSVTGVENHLILENLQKLVELGAPVTVRIPLIPDINTHEDEVCAMAQLLSKLGVQRYELLAFHQLGKGKYRSCGMEYTLGDTPAMTKEQLAQYNQQFAACYKER